MPSCTDYWRPRAIRLPARITNRSSLGKWSLACGYDVKAPKPSNETERLEALRSYHILDTAPEQAYDDLAMLAAQICEAPVALISLVDDARQWFKSKLGLDRGETSRDTAFCAHTILLRQPLIVGDASRDPRFADNALVNGAPHVRFYAGIPLVNAEGSALGALCVIDYRPRRLSLRQREALKALARQVVALLEFRRVSTRLATALEHVRTLEGLLPICSWCKRIRDDHGYWNQVDAYLRDHAGADFTHGICPECLKKQLNREHKKRISNSRLKSS